jgi:hypothetical protein
MQERAREHHGHGWCVQCFQHRAPPHRG